MLSDHVFQLFGRTLTITTNEQYLALLALAVVATAWLVQQVRRKRSVVLRPSPVSDQLIYELARIADALDRISNRPADQLIAAASRQAEEPAGRMPLSMFGR